MEARPWTRDLEQELAADGARQMGFYRDRNDERARPADHTIPVIVVAPRTKVDCFIGEMIRRSRELE
jgi:hypothetical protein